MNISQLKLIIAKFDNNNNNKNNNNNNVSRGMGEVALLYGLDTALVLTKPGVQ